VPLVFRKSQSDITVLDRPMLGRLGRLGRRLGRCTRDCWCVHAQGLSAAGPPRRGGRAAASRAARATPGWIARHSQPSVVSVVFIKSWVLTSALPSGTSSLPLAQPRSSPVQTASGRCVCAPASRPSPPRGNRGSSPVQPTRRLW